MSENDDAELDEQREPLRDAGAAAEIKPETIDQRRRAVLEQKQYVSGKVSETCRYIGFGLVAVLYTLLSSDDAFATEALERFGAWVKLSGALGALAILFDYLQYVSGYLAANGALARKNDGNGTHLYSRKWWSYRIRTFMFVSKQLAAFVGAIIVIIVMARLSLNI